MPALLAPPSPPKKLSGMLITKAQGQLITKKDNARYTHTEKDCCKTSGGNTASNAAAITTPGV